MNKYLISAIALAAVPLSIASAEPTPAPEGTPPASCQQMKHANMQHQMGEGAMGGSGQMVQHGSGGMGAGHMDHGSMGNGAMGSGTMQGQTMEHGDHPGMGTGHHQGMMHGQGQCPASSQTQDSQTDDGK